MLFRTFSLLVSVEMISTERDDATTRTSVLFALVNTAETRHQSGSAEPAFSNSNVI